MVHGSRPCIRSSKRPPQLHGNAPALHQPIGKGKYQTYSWIEYKQRGGGDRVRTAADSASGRAMWLRSTRRLAPNSIWPISASWRTVPSPRRSTPRILCRIRSAICAPAMPKPVFVEDPKTMQALIDAAGRSGSHVQWILLTGEAGDCAHAGTAARRRPQSAGRGSAIIRKDPRGSASGRSRHPLSHLRRHGRTQNGPDHARGAGRQHRYGTSRAAAHARGLHHQFSSLGAHRAARGDRAAADRHGRPGLVFRKPRQAARAR